MTEFEKHLPLINEVVALLERWQLQRQTVNVLAIGNGLHRMPGEIIRLFNLFGIQPVAWNLPEDYEVAAIIETLTRDEVLQRYNRVS